MIIKASILNIFLFSLLSCKNSNTALESEAYLTANEYCQCVSDNIHKIKYIEDIFVKCNTILSERHRLYYLSFQLDSLKIWREQNPQLYDSIKKFNLIFEKYSDSCSVMPIHKNLEKF